MLTNMGKVRTELIKRVSNDLIDKYPKSFAPEFEPNKQFLKEIGFDTSKKLRNKIAGYITTLIKIDMSPEIVEEIA